MFPLGEEASEPDLEGGVTVDRTEKDDSEGEEPEKNTISIRQFLQKPFQASSYEGEGIVLGSGPRAFAARVFFCCIRLFKSTPPTGAEGEGDELECNRVVEGDTAAEGVVPPERFWVAAGDAGSDEDML